MFFDFQFPFLDIRFFLDQDLGKMPAPDFPEYNYAKKNPFIKNFGKAKTKVRDGIGYDEKMFIDARKAIRFPPENLVINSSENHTHFSVCSKRFFSDGKANCRLEIDLVYPLLQKNNFFPLHYDLEYYIQRALQIKTKIAKTKIDLELGQLNTEFLRLYYESTTRKGYDIPATKYFIATSPILVLEIGKNEHIRMPKYAKEICTVKLKNCFLYFVNIKYGAITIPTWILDIYDNTDKERIRLLRLALLRQHYEKECLLHVFSNAAKGIIPTNDRFQEYINNCDLINILTNGNAKQNKYLIQYGDLIRETISYSNMVNPFEIRQALNLCENYGIRKNILDKIDKMEVVMGNQFYNYGRDQGIVTDGGSLYVNNLEKDDPEHLFNELKKIAGKIDDNHKILLSIEAMQKSKNKKQFAKKYKNFISIIADHFTIFAPFIPLLTSML